MPEIRTKKTVADYMRLPDEPRVELFEGEFFVSPSPTPYHQMVTGNIFVSLRAFVRARNLGNVLIAPLDCILSDEVVVQPDVLFVATENLSRIRDRFYGPPDLAVEVISPTNAERDRIVKRDLYAKYGVREYWIADPAAKTIEVMSLEAQAWRPVGVFSPQDEFRSPFFPDLHLSIEEIFE